MRRLCFLLPKHPYAFHGGDTRISRLFMETCADLTEVSAVALWSGAAPEGRVPITVVPKPPVRVGTLLASSARRRRCLLHSRYLTPELCTAVRESGADAFVAEHAYMAEAMLEARPDEVRQRLYVDLHVLESDVLRRRGPRRPPHRWEARRTRRDELRCFRAARATACFSTEETSLLSAAGVGRIRRLDVTLPPEARSVETGPTAIFVGDRGWPPNALALRHLLRLWPRIHRRVPGARLVVAGRPARRERPIPGPGVEIAGFLDDLDAVWRQARVLLAPVGIGGGVRVKVLEAACRGVPVVGFEAAIGSIAEYLPLRPVDGDDTFVEAAVRLLGDAGAARSSGDALFEANAERWSSGHLHRQLAEWLELT